MVLQESSTASPAPQHTLRKLGYTVAYAVLMVTGAALLILAFAPKDDGSFTGPDGKRMTHAEVVMQSAAERALVSPTTAVLAGNSQSNERRGFSN